MEVNTGVRTLQWHYFTYSVNTSDTDHYCCHTPLSCVLLDKLTVTHLVKIFPTFYRTSYSITIYHITDFTVLCYYSCTLLSNNTQKCNTTQHTHLPRPCPFRTLLAINDATVLKWRWITRLSMIKSTTHTTFWKIEIWNNYIAFTMIFHISRNKLLIFFCTDKNNG